MKPPEMCAELLMAVLVVTLDSGLFDGAVHALYLPVGPGMVAHLDEW